MENHSPKTKEVMRERRNERLYMTEGSRGKREKVGREEVSDREGEKEEKKKIKKEIEKEEARPQKGPAATSLSSSPLYPPPCHPVSHAFRPHDNEGRYSDRSYNNDRRFAFVIASARVCSVPLHFLPTIPLHRPTFPTTPAAEREGERGRR